MQLNAKEKELDRKWEIVKDHYERAYKIRFRDRPNEAQINELYRSLQRLKDTESFYKANRAKDRTS